MHGPQSTRFSLKKKKKKKRYYRELQISVIIMRDPPIAVMESFARSTSSSQLILTILMPSLLIKRCEAGL